MRSVMINDITRIDGLDWGGIRLDLDLYVLFNVHMHSLLVAYF